MTQRKQPETGSLFSRLLLVALCAFPPQSQAFLVSPWIVTHPFQEFNRLCSTFAFQDEPARSSPPVPDFTSIREAIRLGQVPEALQDVTRIRSVGESVPRNVYEELVLRCADGRRGPWLQLGREAMELYLNEAMEGRFSPSYKVVRSMLTATSKGGDVVGSLALLRLLASSHPKLVNEYLCFLVLEGCGATRRMSYAEGVLRVMADLRIERSVFVYGALLKGFGRQKWGREVEAIWQELLVQQVVKPDVVLMNNVVDAFVRCNEARRARQVLDDMMACEDGSLPKPDRYTFNTVLKGLASLGEMNAVMDLYRGMQRYGVAPDVITQNTMVDAAVSLGKLDKAQSLLVGGGAAAGVEGYSALLEGFVKKGDLQKANEVLRSMKSAGVSPNVHTYTSLLKGAARSGDLDQMMDIFQAMIGQGEKDPSVRPNVWTYNTVLAGLIRGERMDSALAVWADLKGRQDKQDQGPADGVRADVVTVNTLLDGLLRQDPPRLREAEGLFVEMMEGGTMPDQYTFSILLNAYAPSDRAQEASLMTGPHRLLDLMMRNRDLNLDTTAVNTLLLALVRGRDFKRAIALFDDFKAGNLTRAKPGRPDVITYTILIKGVCESNNMYAGTKIMQMYREMRQRYKIRPDRRLVNSIVNSLAKARSRLGGLEMEDVEEVFEDLRKLGWSEKQIEGLERQSFSYAGLYSESWKEQKRPMARKSRQENEDAFLRRHGWNTFDSSFSPF